VTLAQFLLTIEQQFASVRLTCRTEKAKVVEEGFKFQGLGFQRLSLLSTLKPWNLETCESYPITCVCSVDLVEHATSPGWP